MAMSSHEPVAGRGVGPETLDSAPYWAATREQDLQLQRCRACGRFTFYPRVICPSCGQSELEWTTASGRGTVWSFSVVHRAVSQAFKASVPYVVALVELEEGPRMMSNIVDCDPDDIAIGQQVEVVWEPLEDGRSLPLFTLAATPEAEEGERDQ
jgi:uncharacterized protein